jgi:D-alanyl-D-alanine carboxypeptidase
MRPAPVLFVPVLLAVSPLPRPAEDDLDTRLEALVQRELEGGRARGLSVVVDLGGQTLFEGGWGRVHFGGNEMADPDAPVPAACLMDLLSAVVALQLVDEGQLEPDRELSTYLPGLEWEGQAVTLQHLLTHTSGLPDFEDVDPALRAAEATFGTADAWTRLAEEPLLDVPGRCQTFSGTNTYLVGRLVEQVTEQPLLEVVRARVLEPLELASTRLHAGAAAELDEVGYRVECGGVVEGDPLGTRRFGAADLVTTARDLVALVRGLTGDRAWEELTGVPRALDGEPLSYACGLNRAPLGELRGLTFGGASGHERLYVAHYPDLDLTVALTGDADDGVLPPLTRRTAREVFDLPSPEVEDRALPEGAAELYVGVYQLGCNRLEVRLPEDHLILIWPQRPERALLYQGRHRFVAADDHGLELVFQVEEGPALAFTLDEHGSRSTAVRVSSRPSDT